jgi:hypothetical protein
MLCRTSKDISLITICTCLHDWGKEGEAISFLTHRRGLFSNATIWGVGTPLGDVKLTVTSSLILFLQKGRYVSI